MSTPNSNSLMKLKNLPMPYGKYKGLKLIDLPEPYVIWLYENNLPKGELGQLLSELYEIKVNGLESLIRNLKFD
ncbi:MAG: DUF3820 family protein [Bacteriovoracaceae bacterium]|nr:DUF3820 family protein [Bacteriovoracaceae bacterium]